MARILACLDRLLLGLSGAMVGGIFVITCLQVFFRYFLDEPLVWAEEAARYLFVWAAFIGAAVLVGQGEHYAMPEFVEALSPRARSVCTIAARLLCLLFCAAVLWYGIQWAWRLREADSPVLELSHGAVYAIVPFSAAYMALRLLIPSATKSKDGLT